MAAQNLLEMEQMISCAPQQMEIPRGHGSFLPSLLPVGPSWDYAAAKHDNSLLAGLSATERS